MSAFPDWLSAQADRQDAVGDLARDALADADWPREGWRAWDPTQLHRYLHDHDAMPEVHDALDRALTEWQGP